MNGRRNCGSLVKRYYKINQVLFAEETKIEGDVLYLASDLREKYFASVDQDIV